MATREKRLAQFDGNGDPPPDQPVEVLCEDHSGTYQLPFACRWIDGQWRNDRTGGMVEATVVGGGCRVPASDLSRFPAASAERPAAGALCQNATEPRVDLYVRNGDGTNRAQITDLAPYSVVHG